MKDCRRQVARGGRAALLPLLPLLLGGCFLFGGGQASYSDAEIPEDLRTVRVHAPPISDLHPYGPASEPGRWVRYAVTRGGIRTLLTIGCVRVEEGGAWIEVVEEGGEGGVRRASSRLVLATGRVRKALYREIRPSGASPVVEQPVGQGPEAEPEEPAERSVAEGVGERVLDAPRRTTVVRETYRDEMLGRSILDESVWCADVPGLYASGPHGGLVRRTGGRDRVSVELTAMGAGYPPAIPDPE